MAIPISAPSSDQPLRGPDTRLRAVVSWACPHVEGATSDGGRHGRHVWAPPGCLWPGWGEDGGRAGAHFGLAQQLLELRLRQEAMVLHEGRDFGGPLALVVHGAVDLHVLVQDTQELLLPLEEEMEGMGALLQPQTAEPTEETPPVRKSENMGPVSGRPLTNCVTLRRPLPSLVLNFFIYELQRLD